MRACRSLSVVAAIVAGLAGACRETPAPGSDRNAASSAAAAATRSLSVGDLAPDFSLPGSDGKQYSLVSYRGRQAVVLAWFTRAFSEG
jgi:cytochrome oxidase Cu insertion factor (SCO1/SenC/PrrC family)